jgi:dTDP-glucose pyrophosphorylase
MALRNFEDTCVLIPAAGRVPEGILAFSNITCPAMIPVAGRPLIYWTMQYLLSLGLKRFLIAVSQRQLFLEDFIACTFGRNCEVQFLVPEQDRGVGGTVCELANAASGESALVVLGDTHFQFQDASILEGEDVTVLTSEVDDPYRWCTVDTDELGRIESFHDKSTDVPTPAKALIGVYFFPRLEELRRAGQAALEASLSTGRSVQMAELLNQLPRPSHTAPVKEWLDCGNPDRQAASHRVLLQKRAFNELKIDPILGTITKRSRNTEKFIDEINFLRLLPRDIAVLFPRILDFSTEWNDPFVVMEYYGYATLAEVFVFENVDPGIWDQVFLHLHAIVRDEFTRYRRPLAAQTLQDMYLKKTRNRIDELATNPALSRLALSTDRVIVNDVELANLPMLWPQVEGIVAKLTENAQGTLVHGDLCLSNILYDLRSRVCKMIDPRGSFGSPGIYGDPRYDIAKLYHSVYGLYDFITNDLFEVTLDGMNIRLDVRSRPRHGDICSRFENVFFKHYDRREILLLTGLLFASMPALHYDVPKRQLAMYARAVQLLNEACALYHST